MRTLHVINSLGAGGAERSLAEMLPALLDRGIEPEVVVFRQCHEGVEEQVRQSGVVVHHIARASAGGRIAAVREHIGRFRPDVVHTSIFEADVVGRLSAVRTGVAVTTSLVNTSYAPERRTDPNVARAKLEAVRAIDGWTARHLTRGFHAISEAVAEGAVRDLGIRRQDISVIPRGRRRERLGAASVERRTEVRRSFGIPDDRPVVLNVGRREFQKGQVTLIRAVAELRRTRPEVLLLVAGRDGAAAADLDRLASELDVQDSIRFLGHRDDVPDLLVAADVFCFPSIYEGLGGAVLEAMALGTPVVASDIAVMREVLDGGNAGALVPGRDAPAWAAALDDALEGGTTIKARASAAVRKFETDFDHDRVVERMADWFHSVDHQR